MGARRAGQGVALAVLLTLAGCAANESSGARVPHAPLQPPPVTAPAELDPRIHIEGPDDRPPEDNEEYEPGREWSLTCYQPELNELVGSDGDTLQTQRLIEARLPSDVRARLEWDSEGGMLFVTGSEADIRQVAWAMQAMRPAMG